MLKETIRGMEILESHVYDLLDIVAGTRPDLLKILNKYHGSFKLLDGTKWKANPFKRT